MSHYCHIIYHIDCKCPDRHEPCKERNGNQQVLFWPWPLGISGSPKSFSKLRSSSVSRTCFFCMSLFSQPVKQRCVTPSLHATTADNASWMLNTMVIDASAPLDTPEPPVKTVRSSYCTIIIRMMFFNRAGRWSCCHVKYNFHFNGTVL